MILVATKSFNKDISGIKDKKILQKVETVIRKMEASSTLSEIQNCKKMAGAQHAYRIRIGDYRLGFYVVNGIIQLQYLPIEKMFINPFPEIKLK